MQTMAKSEKSPAAKIKRIGKNINTLGSDRALELAGKIIHTTEEEFYVSDDGTISEEALEKAMKAYKDLKAKIEQQTSQQTPVEQHQENSVLAESIFQKDIYTLLDDLFTDTKEVMSDEGRALLKKAIRTKTNALKPKFIQTGSEHGLTSTEVETNWQAFDQLVQSTLGLLIFGIFRHSSLNTTELSAKQDKLLEAAAIDRAMEVVDSFNKSPLVASQGIDAEQFSPTMGIVQKIVYAMAQEMKKDYDFTSTNTDGQSEQSVYSRNSGYTSKKVDNLLTMVTNLNDFVLRDGNRVSLGIKDTLDQFPEEAQKIIKLAAKWKASRDDIASTMGIFHEGYNKGAPKFDDGIAGRIEPDGLIASCAYYTGKHSARNLNAALLMFVDPRGMDLMERGRPRDRDDFETWMRSDQQNGAIALRLRSIDEFNKMIYPFLHSRHFHFQRYQPTQWYEDFPGFYDFFNQDFPEGSKSSHQYTMARKRMLALLEVAVKSSKLAGEKIGRNRINNQDEVHKLIRQFATPIALIMAYTGSFEDTDNYRYRYVHKFIIKAVEFLLMNILLAIPRKERGMDRDYDQNYNQAFDQIITEMNKNTTLSHHRGPIITWLNANKETFRKPANYSTRLSKRQQKYQEFELAHNPTLASIKALPFPQKAIAQAETLTTPPKPPVTPTGEWVSVKKGD